MRLVGSGRAGHSGAVLLLVLACSDPVDSSGAVGCERLVLGLEATAHTVDLLLDPPSSAASVRAGACYTSAAGDAQGCHTWTSGAEEGSLRLTLLPADTTLEVALHWLDAAGAELCTATHSVATRSGSGGVPALRLDRHQDGWLDDPPYLALPFVDVSETPDPISRVALFDPFGQQVAEAEIVGGMDARVLGDRIVGFTGALPEALQIGETVTGSAAVFVDLAGTETASVELAPGHHRFEPLGSDGAVEDIYSLGFEVLPELSEACGTELFGSTLVHTRPGEEGTVVWRSTDRVPTGEAGDCGFLESLHALQGDEALYMHYANSWEGPGANGWGCLTMASAYTEWQGGVCLKLEGDQVTDSVHVSDASWSDVAVSGEADVFEYPHSMGIWSDDSDELILGVYNRNEYVLEECATMSAYRIDRTAGTIERLGGWPSADDTAACVTSESHGNVLAERWDDGWRVTVNHGAARSMHVLDTSDFVHWELVAEAAPSDPDALSQMRPTFVSFARDVGEGHEVTWSSLP